MTSPLTMRQARRMFRGLQAQQLNTEVSFREWARASRASFAANSQKLIRITQP